MDFYKRGHFGILDNGKITVHISWHGRRHHHNFATSGWISTYEGSIWGSFSGTIQWWGHCTNLKTVFGQIGLKFLEHHFWPIVQYVTVSYCTVPYHTILYCTKGIRGQKVPRVIGFKMCQRYQGIKVPRVPGSKAQKVYSGAGFFQELISDRACLLKKVHLV